MWRLPIVSHQFISPPRRCINAQRIIVLCLSLVFVGVWLGGAYAQTEVSGEVSGEWTVEGSPYTVIDSTWIPEDEDLSIGPGVEIRFGVDVGLYVFGRLIAEGTEDDSVFFHCVEEDEVWKGIHLYNIDSLSSFTYCSLKDAESTILFARYVDILLEHSSLNSSDRPIDRLPQRGEDGGGHAVTIDHCRITAGRGFNLVGSLIIVNDSEIAAGHDPNEEYNSSSWGFYLRSCTIIMENNVQIGGVSLWAGLSQYRNCRFLTSPEQDGRFDIDIWGQEGLMENCYSEGRVVIGPVGVGNNAGDVRVRDCIIESDLRGEIFAGRITRTEVVGKIDMGSSVNILIEDCIFERLYSTYSDRIHLNRCTITGIENISSIYFYGVYCDRDRAAIEVENCSVKAVNRMVFFGRTPHDLYLHNNVFYFDSSGWFAIGLRIDPEYDDARYEIVNNVFYADTARGWSDGLASDDAVEVRYNCIYGFESLKYRERFELTLDSTNIFIDPQFVDVENDDVHLTENSPCIDAGDPDSPLDPDSTRADIGRYYFHHVNSVREANEMVPQDLQVTAPFPNPSNSHFQFTLHVPRLEVIEINVYDLTGRNVQSISNRIFFTGSHLITIDATDLPSGSYFVRFSNGNQIKSFPIELIR